MQKEYQISWGKIIGITILIAIIIIIIALIYPKNNKNLAIEETYINNISLMKQTGFEYFSGNNLPTNIGDSKKITLNELLARNLIVDFLDEEGNSCNLENSYIETTKILDNEYEMGVYLSCNNKSDYIITTIANNTVCIDCGENNESVVYEPSKTSEINKSESSQLVPTYTSNESFSTTSEDKIIKETANININYINTCCSSNNINNCNNNCLSNIYYSVIFDANGGQSVRTQTVKHGSYAEYKSTYRYGYEFLGWYLNGEKYNFSTPVTSKIVLVAKWQKIEEETKKDIYTVTYDSNGGSYVPSEKVLEGNKATKPNNPTKANYKFLGWYLKNEPYDFNTKIYQNITLTAKWEKEEVKYNEYCKIENETYYSISYVSANQNTWDYSWLVNFYDLKNVDNLKVTDIGHLTTNNMYNIAYTESFDKGINMIGGNDLYNVSIANGTMLKSYSLKSSNFNMNVDKPYYSRGKWYATLSVHINNYNNLNPYYANNIGGSIYFVPFYFTVEYTNLNNCIVDKASNSYKYNNYEIVDTYWE